MMRYFNRIAFIVFMLYATYQHTVHHDEKAFVHWMLWAIACGIADLIGRAK